MFHRFPKKDNRRIRKLVYLLFSSIHIYTESKSCENLIIVSEALMSLTYLLVLFVLVICDGRMTSTMSTNKLCNVVALFEFLATDIKIV